jgi:uncharacterized metal-binding protein
MAEQPQCTCTVPEPEGGKNRIIFACAGASNVGQLSNEAAVQLTKEGYGNIACTASLAIRTPSIMRKAGDADEIVIIDGCAVGCAEKIAKAAGVNPDQVIIATDLDIAKGHELSLNEEDLETIVSAAWEGKGRQEYREKRKVREGDHTPDDKGGCGCGGGRCGCN